MGKTYLSIPRFHRLEYLEALLRSYSNGEFDEERARLAVQREIQEFEQKKARHFGDSARVPVKAQAPWQNASKWLCIWT